MQRILLLIVFSIITSALFAQVEINKKIELTGTGSDAKIEGIDEVLNPKDAANKIYVDTAILNRVNSGVIPKMDQTAIDSMSPVAGDLVYNTTTNCLNLFNGTSWRVSCFDCNFPSSSVSNNGPICEGDTLRLTAAPIAGASYYWTGPNGFSSSLQNPVIPNAGAAANGLYSLVVTVNGCSAAPISTNATVNASPQTPTISSNSPVCLNSTLTLSASTVAGASYSWSGPNSFTASSQNPSLANVSLAAGGWYTVTALVSSTGCSSSDTDSISIIQIPSAPGAISGPVSGCVNSTGNVYSITPVPGASSYTWNVPAGATITSGQGTNSITVTFGTNSGNICVSATNTCGTSSQTCLAVNLLSQTTIFTYTGDTQFYVVPPCASTINLKAWGGEGGNSGGLGGYSEGDLTVSPGDTLWVFVGGQGLGVSNGGGWNGGGNGAYCGGGGASDIRLNGVSLTNRVIVAGGGGGRTAWGSSPGQGGGTTGGSAGQSNVYSCSGTTARAYGGGGGTQTTGGAAGSYSAGSYGGNNGHPGVLGFGGGSDGWNNGGGGGGYYGGGSGGTPGCSGWGASGGGGSGYIQGLSAASMQSGVRSGNGRIEITY